MKILLFGGTFDPPHNGHVALLRGAVHVVRPQRVLVMPAGIPPHKSAAHTAAKTRLSLCRTFLHAVRGCKITVDKTEIKRAGKSFSIDTVCALQKRYPGSEIYFCIGSDMLLGFYKWRSWQQLLQKVTLVVQSRETDDAEELAAFAENLRRDGGKVLFTMEPAVVVSSTEIRARLANGQTIHDLVPRDVAEKIERFHLYEQESE